MTRRDNRGQTLHDFAIGMTIFLLVLGYVFAFIPSLFAPFAPATDSSAVRADRTAEFLTQDVLAERGPGAGDASQTNAGVLDPDCTEDFFNGSEVTACPVTATSVRALVGIPDRTNFRITMQRERDGTVTHAVGPEPTVAADQVIQAVRIVSLEGQDYRFVVRLW